MRALALFASLAPLLTGCLTARLHAGPTVDRAGNVGVQGGFTIGVAKPIDRRHGVFFVERIVGGAVPSIPAGTLAVQVGVDWLNEPEEARGWAYRIGGRLGGDYTFREVGPNDTGYYAMGVAVAVFPYSRRRGDDSYREKEIFTWRSTSWTNMGVELQMTFDPAIANERQLIFAAAFSWEIAILSND